MAGKKKSDALIEMSNGVIGFYKAATDNILFLKRQQWTITNHSLVLYAAVIALARDTNDLEKAALTGISVIGCAFAIYCMLHTQRTMTRYRGNLYDIYQKYLTPKERLIFNTWEMRPSFNYTGEFIYGLIVANAVAFAVAVYVIWKFGGLPAILKTGGNYALAIPV